MISLKMLYIYKMDANKYRPTEMAGCLDYYYNVLYL